MTTIDTTETPAAQIAAILRAHGVAVVGEIRECHDIRKRPGSQPSWCIELAPGARIPAEVWTQLQPGCWRSGQLYVVQMKGSV